MKKIALLVSATALLIAIACQHKDANLFFKLDTPFSLDQGNLSAWEENDVVQVRFEKVIADSRCPVDAICVWAGRVEVKVSFTQAGNSQTQILALGDNAGTAFSNIATFGDFTVELLSVLPAPKSDYEIPQNEYKIEVVVKKE